MKARQPERRRFFRIDDHVRLSFEPVSDLRHLPGVGGSTPGSPTPALLNELDRQFNTVLNALSQENPLAGKALALLNRKVDLLCADREKGNAAGTPLVTGGDPTPVNISASGIAFQVDEPLPEGQLLNMHISLLPSETELRITTRVVALEPVKGSGNAEAGPFWLRAEFAGYEAVAQETLISHLVQRQQALIAPTH